MKTNNKAKRKLIPAAAMLAISAAMLSTATYAWFTMSKEAEITGINMTATVPAGLQLSLGLAQGTGGTLTAIGSDTSSGVDMVKAPLNNDTSGDWSNSVQFSRYYQVSKLSPASSTTGGTIYYTENVTGVGKTLTANATSVAATSGAAKELISSANTNALNTEGFYVDFPVWFRSAESGDVGLSVKATVKAGSATDNQTGLTNKIYKAARVSILSGASINTSSGVIVPFDSSNNSQGTYYTRADKGSGVAINTAATNDGSGSIFGELTKVNQTGETGTATTVVTVPGKTSSLGTDTYSTGNCTDNSTNYGNAVCVIVRVWLEGEDEDCWNATAGQDFDLSLTFTEITT